MDEVHYAYSNEEIQHYQEIRCVLNLQSFAFYSKRQSKARNTNKCGMHWPHWDQWTEKSNTKERRSAQEHSITKTNSVGVSYAKKNTYYNTELHN